MPNLRLYVFKVLEKCGGYNFRNFVIRPWGMLYSGCPYPENFICFTEFIFNLINLISFHNFYSNSQIYDIEGLRIIRS